jgi:hypothetical protein
VPSSNYQNRPPSDHNQCGNCGLFGHWRKDCPLAGQVRCTKCNEKGHPSILCNKQLVERDATGAIVTTWGRTKKGVTYHAKHDDTKTGAVRQAHASTTKIKDELESQQERARARREREREDRGIPRTEAPEVIALLAQPFRNNGQDTDVESVGQGEVPL